MSSFIAFGVRLIAQPLNYSGIIAGLFVERFRSLETVAGSLSLLFSHSKAFCTVRCQPPGPETLSAQCIEPLARVRNLPEPDSDSHHRWVRIIPKRLQNITVFLFGRL